MTHFGNKIYGIKEVGENWSELTISWSVQWWAGTCPVLTGWAGSFNGFDTV